LKFFVAAILRAIVMCPKRHAAALAKTVSTKVRFR
jgi:hypothetical protein